MMRSVVDQFNEYAKLNKKLSQEAGDTLGDIEDVSKLADTVAGHISAKVSDKQALLTEMIP
jgi:ATP-dependent Lon protease